MAMRPAALSSARDILTFDFPGLPATTFSGTNISVTVPYGTDVSALAPIHTLSPLATCAPASGAVRNFTTPQTYTVTAQDGSTQAYTVTVTVGPSPFSTWAADPAQGLTAGVNDGPNDDPDHDGIVNLMEFTLGGAPMVSGQAILPKLTKSTAGVWAFEYDRSDLSLAPATTQVVEYGDDLTGWTAVTIPTVIYRSRDDHSRQPVRPRESQHSQSGIATLRPPQSHAIRRVDVPSTEHEAGRDVPAPYLHAARAPPNDCESIYSLRHLWIEGLFNCTHIVLTNSVSFAYHSIRMNMFTRHNSSEAISMCSMMSGARWFSALFAALALAQSAAWAQTSYPLTSGGYLGAGAAATPDTYNAGYTFYSAAWPLLGDYPRNNQIQTGLYGTWMFPSMSITDGPYTDIEGGLGWWFGREFQTATPKFIMGGVAWGNNSWWFANSPGSGSAGGNGKYGAAQLSPSLLMPPDGLNLRQGTSGRLFGYGYLALPLTQPKTTTAGVAVPTGNHCWTLFLNTGNFKGPAAFFTPYFWSQVTVTNPQWAGQMFDSRWAQANKSISMETPGTIHAAGCDTAESTFVRSMPVYFPVDSNGYSLLMHRLSVYDQGALWDDVGQWLTGSGPAPGGVIDPGSTYVQTATGYSPVWGLENGAVSLGSLNWDGMVTPYAPNQQEWGYQWATHELTVIPSTNGSLVRLPEYYQGPTNANSTSKWFPIDAGNVPESVATVLAGANFSNPSSHSSVVLADSNAGWTNPGPVAGPNRALLGDGSVVTYYWYRFADQPALLNADMTVDERNQLQTVVEKMHREWKNDRDYTAPPTAGTLADLDPGQLVTPPLGLEYGYVPIAWRQDWGGSATSPGALDFTSIPATPVAGTPFNVTVRAVNANGAAQNVTSGTLVQLSVASGYGTLSGTTVATIPSGSSSVTIAGVIYSAADTMTLTASATCLSSGTSPSITFTNSSGKVNLYNRPATGIATNQAMLNATLDCRGTNADVHVYWGIYNGGTNPAGWTHSAYVGAWTHVVSTNISSAATELLPDTTYYFIFRGTNASGLTWASKVLSFTTPPLAPVITGQPVSSTKVAGSTASFTVAVSRATHYQWFKGAVPLANGGQVSGTDTATLSLSGVAAGDAGSYSVVVSNGSGQATSATASLTVVAATTLTWDANGTGASVTDGGGQWAGNTWWNGAANVNWADNHNARIGSGGSGGIINLNEVVVNDLTLSNFSGTYTLGNGTLTVAGNLTFNASGSAKLSPVMRGAGSLTKSGAGTLTVDGVNPNTYNGGTVVNSGTLVWGTMVAGISPECGFACGTGPVTLNSGATIRFERAKPINALTLNGGTLISSNGWGVAWSGPVTVNSNTTVQPNYKMDILGDISGPGGFTKTGSATLTLSGSNTYSGTTVVQTGTMSWLRAVSMSPGPLSISNGAVAGLNFTGTRIIGNLTLGGAAMAPGSYGSTASPATNKNDTYFSGTGTVTILPATTTALALTGGGTPANPGSPLTFTATVTGTAPTGNVAFHTGTTLLGSSALNGSFQAGFTTSSLAIGSHSITAKYAGNATNAASTSAALAIQITSVTAASPANLFAAPGNNNINLTWTTSAGAASYYVKRALANGGPYTVIANPITASYPDLTAVNGTTYYYVVSALNAAGESANSAQASAIPAPLPVQHDSHLVAGQRGHLWRRGDLHRHGGGLRRSRHRHGDVQGRRHGVRLRHAGWFRPGKLHSRQARRGQPSDHRHVRRRRNLRPRRFSRVHLCGERQTRHHHRHDGG